MCRITVSNSRDADSASSVPARDFAAPDRRRLLDHNSPRGGPTPTRAAEDVRIEASGGDGGPLQPWSANGGGVAGPSGVGAEVGALLILLMVAFVLWLLY